MIPWIPVHDASWIAKILSAKGVLLRGMVPCCHPWRIQSLDPGLLSVLIGGGGRVQRGPVGGLVVYRTKTKVLQATARALAVSRPAAEGRLKDLEIAFSAVGDSAVCRAEKEALTALNRASETWGPVTTESPQREALVVTLTLAPAHGALALITMGYHRQSRNLCGIRRQRARRWLFCWWRWRQGGSW